MHVGMFLLKVFLVKVFSPTMFLGKSLTSVSQENSRSGFSIIQLIFKILKFLKFCQALDVFSKTFLRLKTLPRCTVKYTTNFKLFCELYKG